MSILLSNLLAGSYQGDKGEKGTTGDKGEQGSFGGASFNYTYDSSTANTDPTTGKLAFNATDLSTATALLINHTDSNAEDINSFIHTIDDSTSAIKGHFTVTEVANLNNFAIFSIVGDLTEVTSYDYVPIAYLSGSTSFTDETPVTITLARTGDVGDKGQKGDTGAQGDKGDQGSQGVQGAKGDLGDKGDKGETGSKGDKGDTGAAGDKGDTGAKGDKGEAGTAGDKGDTGAKGDTGTTGDKGDTGTTGSQGDKGEKGDTGADGSKGETGAKGDKGDTGVTGDKGDTGEKGQKGSEGTISDYLYKTTSYTASPKDVILADTSGGGFTITLPASPTAGMWVRISDGDNWGNNNLTVARNSQTIEGVADDIVLDIGNLIAEFTFTGTTWLVTTTLGTKGDKGESGGIDLSAVTNTAILFADSGNANGSGALTFNKSTNTVTIAGSFVPAADITYDLGTANNRFRDLYLSGNTLVLGTIAIQDSGNGSIQVATVDPETGVVNNSVIPTPVTGDKGDKGDTGAKGDLGTTGTAGDKGQKGEPGDGGGGGSSFDQTLNTTDAVEFDAVQVGPTVNTATIIPYSAANGDFTSWSVAEGTLTVTFPLEGYNSLPLWQYLTGTINGDSLTLVPYEGSNAVITLLEAGAEPGSTVYVYYTGDAFGSGDVLLGGSPIPSKLNLENDSITLGKGPSALANGIYITQTSIRLSDLATDNAYPTSGNGYISASINDYYGPYLVMYNNGSGTGGFAPGTFTIRSNSTEYIASNLILTPIAGAGWPNACTTISINNNNVGNYFNGSITADTTISLANTSGLDTGGASRPKDITIVMTGHPTTTKNISWAANWKTASGISLPSSIAATKTIILKGYIFNGYGYITSWTTN